MKISKKGGAITGSLTLAVDAKAKAMRAKGMDVIGFGAGEPDFDTPDYIKQAAVEALNKGITKYTPVAGTLELRRAICDKLKAQNGVEYKPSQIVVSNGAKHSLFNVFQCLLDPGDEVLIMSPYWVSYPEMVKMADGVPVFVPTCEENYFAPALADIQSAITARTKAVIVNSPGNPCGAVIPPETMREITDLMVKKGITIISDEIYEELIYDGRVHVSPASFSQEAKAATIIVNGFSKAYAMTGWRLGYTACEEGMAKAMSDYQSHAASNPNSIAQYAAVAALKGDAAIIKNMVDVFAKRRVTMVNMVNDTALLSAAMPGGAFYVMMNISGVFGKVYNGAVIQDSLTFCDALLEAQQVAVVPGVAFGNDNYVRLSYATSEENITKGLGRIKAFIDALE